MQPEYTTRANPQSIPIDLAKFRLAAFVSKEDYGDDILPDRIESAIDLIEERTDLKILRADYQYNWKEFPQIKYDYDEPLTVVGLNATTPTVFTVDNEGTETAYTDFYQAFVSDIGSIQLYPNDRYWKRPNGVYSVRVKTQAGCDLQTNILPPKFFEAVALAFRFLYNGEKNALDSADMILSKWVVSGSRV